MTHESKSRGVLGKIILWTGIIVAVGTASAFVLPAANGVVRLGDVMSGKVERKIHALNRDMVIVKWYLPAIGQKLGIPPPPAPDGRPKEEDGGE